MTPEERLRLLPHIRRARGYRLYGADGSRYLDLWQAGGRAILGHRGAGVVSVLKRVAERGVLVGLPSPGEHRLARQLERLIGGDRRMVVFRSAERARTAVARAFGLDEADAWPRDPVLTVIGGGQSAQRSAVPTGMDNASTSAKRPVPSLWRPFVPGDLLSSIRVDTPLVPVLPAGALAEVEVVLVPRDAPADLVSDLVPDALLAMMTSAAAALAAASAPPVVPLEGFVTAGPYLVVRDVDGYDAIFRRFLTAGIVLSPDPMVPSIVPAEMSDGERALLIRTAAG